MACLNLVFAHITPSTIGAPRNGIWSVFFLNITVILYKTIFEDLPKHNVKMGL